MTKPLPHVVVTRAIPEAGLDQIGRASRRERV